MSKFSLSQYTQAFKKLLPPGVVWRAEPGSVQESVLSAHAQEFVQSDTDAIALIKGAFPSTATTMLSEWEETLGLPDDCAISESTSMAARQKAVVSRLTATGGQSNAYYIAFAAQLGYTITITEYRRAMAGFTTCGAALNGDDWPFVCLITAPETTINYAQAGAAYCGDPLRSWGNKTLECKLKKIAPSHIIMKFGYES